MTTQILTCPSCGEVFEAQVPAKIKDGLGPCSDCQNDKEMR
jgi:hypothetical protein